MTLASGLDISVTAEGVETSEQFERLRTLEGVNFAQGYLLGRPMPMADLEKSAEIVSLATGRGLGRDP